MDLKLEISQEDVKAAFQRYGKARTQTIQNIKGAANEINRISEKAKSLKVAGGWTSITGNHQD